jgi:hypothetical protein
MGTLGANDEDDHMDDGYPAPADGGRDGCGEERAEGVDLGR